MPDRPAPMTITSQCSIAAAPAVAAPVRTVAIALVMTRLPWVGPQYMAPGLADHLRRSGTSIERCLSRRRPRRPAGRQLLGEDGFSCERGHRRSRRRSGEGIGTGTAVSKRVPWPSALAIAIRPSLTMPGTTASPEGGAFPNRLRGQRWLEDPGPRRRINGRAGVGRRSMLQGRLRRDAMRPQGEAGDWTPPAAPPVGSPRQTRRILV